MRGGENYDNIRPISRNLFSISYFPEITDTEFEWNSKLDQFTMNNSANRTEVMLNNEHYVFTKYDQQLNTINVSITSIKLASTRTI